MNTRNPNNHNLTLTTSGAYNGYQVQTGCGALNVQYLAKMEQVINQSVAIHPRTFAVRVDFHYPIGMLERNNVMNDFFKRFKYELKAKEKRKIREGNRVHKTEVNYIWVKEIGKSNNHHYHLLILLNKDSYAFLGQVNSDKDNLFKRIVQSWAGTLGLEYDFCKGLVHIPNKPVYKVNLNDPNFTDQINKLKYRVSYFAKTNTKQYGDRSRCFGTSRIRQC